MNINFHIKTLWEIDNSINAYQLEISFLTVSTVTEFNILIEDLEYSS